MKEMRAMSDETTAEMLAEIDRDLADIEKAVSALQQQAARANYPQQLETTTDRLAEIEAQAADYTPPEGWRVLQVGEVLEDEDWLIDPRNGNGCPTRNVGSKVGQTQVGEHQIYIRRIEPEPEQIITPDDVAAEALAGVNEWPSVKILRQEMEATELALLEQQQRNEELVTQGSQQRMQIAELQAQVRFLKNRELTLGTRLDEEKAVTTKRLQQVQELRSEVSHVQRLWGESRRRVEELETLVADLRAVNAATEPLPVHLQAMIDAQAETIARLNSEIHGLSIQNAELVAQREAVKDELVQVSKDRQALQIELDAREQVPTSTDDRFEQGWDAGNARAVETIAEWLEPIRHLIDAADNVEQTERASNLAADIMQNLPAIMRSLTGLADED